MRDEELEIRNEELGINVVGPLGRVLFCGGSAESGANG